MTETYLSGLASFLGEGAWEQLAHDLRLSPRELQITRAVFEDRKESAIARQLHISADTVHTYMARLHRKLSVGTRAQLILKILATFLLLTANPDNSLPPICGNRASGRCPLSG